MRDLLPGPACPAHGDAHPGDFNPKAGHPHYREQAALLLPVGVGLSERDFFVETRIGAAAFSVALTGKDGGKKLRRDKPQLPAELFALWEAKPMWRQKIRHRQPDRK